MKGIVLCIMDFLQKTFSPRLFSLCLLACLALSVGFSFNASARTATSFGIRDYTTDNGSTWSALGTPPNTPFNAQQFTAIDEGKYLRGVRLVNYGDWGNGNYYSGSVTINVTVVSSAISSDYTILTNRVGSGQYDSAVVGNTQCALGAYGTVPVSYSPSNFSARWLGSTFNGLWRYDGWLISWTFVGQMGSSYSGSYDAYCRIYPGSSNSEWFYYRNGADASGIYIDTQTSLTINVSTTQNDSLLQQQIEQNNTIIEQNNAINDSVNHPDWVDEQNDAVQDAYDDAQSDFEVNSDIDQISNKVSTLLGVLTSAVTAVSNPSITNCIIPFDLSRYSGGLSTDVDLCYLSPPSGITNVLNVIVVGFMIVVIVSLIRSIFALYREVITN